MADNPTEDLIFGCRWHQCLEELQDVLQNQKTSKYASAPSNYLVCCATSICASLVLSATSHPLRVTARGGGYSAGKKMRQWWWRQGCCHMQQGLIIGHVLAPSPPKIYKNVNEHEVAWRYQGNLKQQWKPFNRQVRRSAPLLELVEKKDGWM